MGLYDGDGSSTAAVAETLGLPVVLVVDASAGMESVAATALGFRAYADRIGRGIDVVGVIAQRAHGGRHADGIREALPDDLTYFGRIPPNDDLAVPDRHLGLHMGDESPVPDDALDAAAEDSGLSGSSISRGSRRVRWSQRQRSSRPTATAPRCGRPRRRLPVHVSSDDRTPARASDGGAVRADRGRFPPAL